MMKGKLFFWVDGQNLIKLKVWFDRSVLRTLRKRQKNNQKVVWKSGVLM